MIEKFYDAPLFTIEVNEGIVYFQHKPGTIDLAEAKEIVNDRLELFRGKAYPLLITGEGIPVISKEARQYLTSGKGIEGIVAGALLSNSVFSAFMGNFLIRVSNPGIPVRLFTDKAKALEWLRQYTGAEPGEYTKAIPYEQAIAEKPASLNEKTNYGSTV